MKPCVHYSASSAPLIEFVLPLQAVQAAKSIRMQLLGLIYPTISLAAYIESGLGLNYTVVSSLAVTKPATVQSHRRPVPLHVV